MAESQIEIDVIKNTNNNTNDVYAHSLIMVSRKRKTKQQQQQRKKNTHTQHTFRTKKKREKRNHRNYIVTHLRFVCDSAILEWGAKEILRQFCCCRRHRHLVGSIWFDPFSWCRLIFDARTSNNAYIQLLNNTLLHGVLKWEREREWKRNVRNVERKMERVTEYISYRGRNSSSTMQYNILCKSYTFVE